MAAEFVGVVRYVHVSSHEYIPVNENPGNRRDGQSSRKTAAISDRNGWFAGAWLGGEAQNPRTGANMDSVPNRNSGLSPNSCGQLDHASSAELLKRTTNQDAKKPVSESDQESIKFQHA
jgi:hypothetical protein